MVCNSPVYFYPLRYRRSILTAVMLGSLLPGYRVAGNGPHNNRRLALWSRYNSARYVNILVNAIKSNKQLIMRHYCVNITRYLVFELYTPVFTVGMNSRISRRFYFQPSLLVINIPGGSAQRRRPPVFNVYIHRPSLLSATSSPLSPVHSYGGYATSLFIRLDSLLREIWIRWFERFGFIDLRDYCVNITIDYNSMLREI